jgi:hypothetical protein
MISLTTEVQVKASAHLGRVFMVTLKQSVHTSASEGFSAPRQGVHGHPKTDRVYTQVQVKASAHLGRVFMVTLKQAQCTHKCK